MSVFVDTGVLYADHDSSAAKHDTAVSALESVYSGRFGQPITSDYVYDEALTLTLHRTGDFEAARKLGRRILGDGQFPSVYSLEFVNESVFQDTNALFDTYDDQGLSFTDASTIALVERNDIDVVLSFDDDFDGLVERIVPENVDSND
ncbi:MAG: type II toxin-antitoxin system VapC family toxin [Halodesulfurarchaeum sp.]|nr:type II toxin-antitoxin system VapC family toxin [Halodesulfurarchaeum sp.]